MPQTATSSRRSQTPLHSKRAQSPTRTVLQAHTRIKISPSSSIPYNLSSDTSKKRRRHKFVIRTNKKARAEVEEDRKISLPEESDMDENVRELHGMGDSPDSNYEEGNNDAIDDMLQALSRDLNRQKERDSSVKDNLGK